MSHRVVALMVLSTLVSGCAALRAGNHFVVPDASAREAPVVRSQSNTAEPLPERQTGTSPAAHGGDAVPSAAEVDANRRDGGQAQKRILHLRDAIQLALSHSDVVRTLDGGIRISPATKYNPLIAESQLRANQAKFDPRIQSQLEGSHIDEPPSSFFGPGISTETRRDEGTFSAEVVKPWRLGTTTRAAYSPPLGYLYLPQGTTGFNPTHSSEVLLEVRQPLLRGAGEAVNVAPIRIAQWKFEQSRWDVQEATNAQIRSVEQSYWELYASHIQRDAIEEVIPLATESVRLEELRFEAQRNIYADVARAKVNAEDLRRLAIQADLEVREREFRLRNLVGISPQDGSRIVPVDAPKQTRTEVDVSSLVAAALDSRPDLNRQRSGVQVRAWELRSSRNEQLPQLDARALYRTSGLSDSLDESLNGMTTFDNTDWTLGVTFSMPIGNRRLRAETESAAFQLARDRALLKEFEEQVNFQLNSLVAELDAAWQQYDSAMRRRKETEEWLRLSRVRYENPRVGDNSLLVTLQDYQSAQRAQIAAMTDVGRALADYNTTLARINEAQGISMEAWRIILADEAEPHEAETESQPAMEDSAGRSLESGLAPAWGHSLTPRRVGGVIGTKRYGGHSFPRHTGDSEVATGGRLEGADEKAPGRVPVLIEAGWSMDAAD